MTVAKPVLGIDFGTTNTAAAWVDDQRRLRMVPIVPGTFTMPSIVHIRDNGRAIVGSGALEHLVSDPDRTFYGIKRFLGRRYRSEFVTRNQHRFPFPLVEAQGGLCATVVDGQEVSLAALARHIVNRIVELANAAAGTVFEQCVVAVPAHSTQRQRQLVREVVQQVLEVKAIVNEPTAAAIAFSHHEKGRDFRDIFVYDLGGGTFDTTFLRVNQNLIEVLATGGDAFLGGTDFDSKIVDLLCEHLENKHGLDVRNDQVVMQRLSSAAEKAKIACSTQPHADMRVPFVGQVGDKIIDLNVRIQKRDIENLCAPLIEKTVGICEQLRGDDPADAFIFVGGQTKMPALRERLGQLFPVANTTLDPEAAVAAGAAWVGSGAHALLDVLSVPVGVMVAGAAPVEALPRHTPVPVTRRIPIARPVAEQPLSIAVFQALDKSAVERDLMGVVRVDTAWLDDNPGDLVLEVRMTAAFELNLLLHSQMGARLPLEFDARQQIRSSPTTTKSTSTGSTRGFDRPIPTLTFGIKDGAGNIRWYEAEEVRRGAVFLATSQPLQVNAEVEVGLMLPSKPARLRGRVTASLSTCSGMNIEFSLPPEQAADYEAFAEQAVLTDRSEQGDSERLTQFLNGIEAKNAYSALMVAPTATPAEVRRAIGVVRGVLARQRSRWPDSLKKRLERLENVLDNTARILLGGYTRLVHDFRLGRVMAAQRLAGANERQIEVMRRAWQKVHPDMVHKAAQFTKEAREIYAEGDKESTRHLLGEALRHDPFNPELHRLTKII